MPEGKGVGTPAPSMGAGTLGALERSVIRRSPPFLLRLSMRSPSPRNALPVASICISAFVRQFRPDAIDGS
jgi:hypothetical protein